MGTLLQPPSAESNDEPRVPSGVELVLCYYNLRHKMRLVGNTLRGPSPFREDSAETFIVDLENDHWHDNPMPLIDGHEASNNYPSLVMAIEGCGFGEAINKIVEEIFPMASMLCGVDPVVAAWRVKFNLEAKEANPNLQ